jgi:hypothetical protein
VNLLVEPDGSGLTYLGGLAFILVVIGIVGLVGWFVDHR